MRLVLLPGLNGSSRLFSPLLTQLTDTPCQVLELPQRGPQDHDSLTERLIGDLGTAPFVLLGESFSGPLAYRLALRQPPGLCGVIYAASFLQRPHALLALASRLPLPKGLLIQPWLLRLFCIADVEPAVLQCLQAEIHDLPTALISARLKALAQLRTPTRQLAVPALHLWPTQDRLVADAAAASISRSNSDLHQARIDGPHFLLQSRPQACATAIRSFMTKLQA